MPTLPSSKRNLLSIIALTFATFFIVLVSTEVILYSRNTLQNHPEWISGKMLLSSPSMGAGMATATRNILSRNRLNLHAWHGCNEILLNKVFQLGSLRLNIYLGENACISILYNKNRDSFAGVRLSRNTTYKNIFFHASTDGQFLQKQDIKKFPINNKWHEVELKFQSPGLELIWDGVLIQSIQEDSLEEQVVGFRSEGPFEAIVDNVRVLDHKGKLVINEDFRNDRHYWRLAIELLGLSAVALMLVFLVATMSGVHTRSTAKWVLLTEIYIINLLLVYLCFDYFFYSNRYPYTNQYPYSVGKEWHSGDYRFNFIENIRFRFFNSFSFLDTDSQKDIGYIKEVQKQAFLRPNETDIDPAGFRELQVIWSGARGEDIRVFQMPQLLDFFHTIPLKSFYKIIFFGTSQTWGEGALLRKNQMVFQVYRFLQSIYGDKLKFFIVNAGLRAANSEAMLEIYKKWLFKMEPEMVVVNLSNNDTTSGFRDNLLAMAEISKKHKNTMFLIKEANSPDYMNTHLKRNHEIITNISAEKSISCIDLHSYLSSPDIVDSGFLWWDGVHLTAYGQKTAGIYIAQEIHSFLN